MLDGHARGVSWRTFAAVVALAAMLVLVAGCGTPGTGGGTGSTTATGTPATGGGTPPDGPVMIVPDSIPDGTTIKSPTGGNDEYTFRSLWKKALPEALKWKADAYLSTAAGAYVNDTGVPSEWTMIFRSRAGDPKDFAVYIDPWGKVTRTVEINATKTDGTEVVPPSIIDSDEAVKIALPALLERVRPEETRDPALGLGFSAPDGPFWYYIVFEKANAQYITVTIEAVTGKVVSVK
jgi:hypothetical protein